MSRPNFGGRPIDARMTALTEYQRLEAPGLWRPAPGAQRRDVIVSLGEASLVITDMSDRALAHWSLPAVLRVNPGATPALFRPGEDATEDLEIEDATMVAAVEKVRTTIARRRPQPGRLRQSLLVAGLLAVAAVGVVWLPGALIRHTAAVVPEAQRAAIGAELLGEVRRVAGAPCETPQGLRALGRLRDRLLGPEWGRLVVLRAGIPATAHLPGGIILVNRSLVEDHEAPAVAAGFVLAEAERAAAGDPLLALLQEAGPFAAFRLLTTGRIPSAVLAREAERLMSMPPEPVGAAALVARFRAAGVSTAPYAYANDVTGEATLALIEADPLRADPRPILSDGDWIALQGICE